MNNWLHERGRLLALSIIEKAVDDLFYNGSDVKFEHRSSAIRFFTEDVEWCKYLCEIGGASFDKLMDRVKDEL